MNKNIENNSQSEIKDDEDKVTIKYDEFKKVINSRRSVRVFTEDIVPDEVLNRALNDGLKAPNSSNLQPWKFIWVKSKEERKLLAKNCLSQNGAKTAQHLIVCIAQTNTWKKNCQKNIDFMRSLNSKVPRIVENYYKKIALASYGLMGPFGFPLLNGY